MTTGSILLYSKSSGFREFLSSSLKSSSHELLEAKSPRDLLEITACEANLALLLLQGSDGDDDLLSVIAELRKLNRTQHFFIFLLLREGTPADSIFQKYQAGANEVLVQPVPWDVLLSKIETACYQYEFQQNLTKRTMFLAQKLNEQDETLSAVVEEKIRLEAQMMINTLQIENLNNVLMDNVHKCKNLEEDLQWHQIRYKSIFDNAIEGIFQTSPGGKYLNVNQSLVTMYGYEDKHELMASLNDISMQLYVEPQRRTQFVQAMEKNNVLTDFESRIYRKDGSIIWIKENARVIHDLQGQVLYYEGTVEDITARKLEEQRFAEELEQARQTQKSIFPATLPEIPEVNVACRFVPFSKIGGDYYNILDLGSGKYGFVIADVTGHGISAALIAFMVSTVFRNAVEAGNTRHVLKTMNDFLVNKLEEGKFVTVVYAIYDAVHHTFTYSNGGHYPVIRIQGSTGSIQQLTQFGLPIGIFREAHYMEETIELTAGDKILFYTDAIVEVQDPQNNMPGMNGILTQLELHHHLPMEKLIQELYEYGLQYSAQRGYQDDLTLMGFELLGTITENQ
ncbi:MAG: SpoIIE family protein phosphatase [SAR324 cluster bacterium]|nr:SpoIIE family protein phosphatase [SAR324 cluster bacterium]